MTGTLLEIPSTFVLEPAYPNPFNPITTLDYSLPKESNIELFIYNISGEKIIELYKGQKQAGYHSQDWNAEGLPSGIYFVKLNAENIATGDISQQIQKLMLVK